MTVTWTGAFAICLAAYRPPKPPPIMTTCRSPLLRPLASLILSGSRNRNRDSLTVAVSVSNGSGAPVTPAVIITFDTENRFPFPRAGLAVRRNGQDAGRPLSGGAQGV